MRKLLTFISIISCFVSIFGQAPEGINYQAVMRDANGNPTSQKLSVTFEIFSNESGTGIPDFSETYPSVTPDITTGLFNLTIGKNNPNQFNKIDWASGSKFMKVTINGISGPITQMVSVPYALYAKSAGNTGPIYLAGQGISISDNIITNSGDLNSNDDINIGSLAGGDLTGTYPDPIISSNAIGTNEIIDSSITKIDIASGVIPTSLPPDGVAGGDLTGTYPDPIISSNAIGTTEIIDSSIAKIDIASGVIPTSLPPDGVAGGDLTGTYPEPIISSNAIGTNEIIDSSITKIDIASGVIPTSLPPEGEAGGDLTGTYPDPIISSNSIGTNEIIDSSIVKIDIASGVIPTSLPPNGIAGGDLTGEYPNPFVSKIQGYPIEAREPFDEQILKWDGTKWKLDKDKGVSEAGPGISIIGDTIINSGDLSDTNEIQQLYLNGNNLTLTKEGGTVILPVGIDSQTLSIDGNQLSISNGNSVTLPAGSVNGEKNHIAKFDSIGTSLTNSNIIEKEDKIGIGVIDPDDKLDVNGNSQITGYLKVGNPTIPDSINSYTPIPLYKLSYLSGTESWSVNNWCGDHSSDHWYVEVEGNKSGLMYYQSRGFFNRSISFSPWIWVPSGSFNLTVEGTFYCGLEDNYDGVFLEFRTEDSDWVKISSFDYGGYPDYADGCNTYCNGKDPQFCWNGMYDKNFFRIDNSIFSPSTFGKWIRFRFIGMEDSSGGDENFELYGFNVTAFGGTSIGGTFEQGNIYAEKNVYAGSNVLLGDVAEYFKVDTETQSGDLIAISEITNDSYTLSRKAYNPKILGIHSTNPTVTLNAPNGIPVSLTGRVPVNVCLESGLIKIGDYLTSSSIPGYAMKADIPCFVIGRALENYNGNGTGKILCIVESGWYNPVMNSNNQSGGSFFIEKDKTSVTIIDPSVNSGSRVFVTFRENAGSYWVNDISEGKFSISIEKSINKKVPFDYFVDNAIFPGLNNKEKDISISKTQVKLSEKMINGSNKMIEMDEYSDLMPPSQPPDPKIGWTWSEKSGFSQTSVMEKHK